MTRITILDFKFQFLKHLAFRFFIHIPKYDSQFELVVIFWNVDKKSVSEGIPSLISFKS